MRRAKSKRFRAMSAGAEEICRILFLAALFAPAAGLAANADDPESAIEKTGLDPAAAAAQAVTAAGAADLHGYRAAMESFLSAPARIFAQTVSAPSVQRGRNIYETLSGWLTSGPNGQTMHDSDFYQEALDLLIAITPPLGKKDKDGMTAMRSAKMRGNKPLAQVLRKHKRIKSAFELDAGDKGSFWSRSILPSVPLEETALAQAVLREDPKAFSAALEVLESGPARDFLSLLHSRTSDGDSLFHLTARVSSHREEFAAGIDSLITFISPKRFYLSTRMGETAKEKFWENAAAAAAGGGSAGFILLTPAYPEAGGAAGILALAGAAAICHQAIFINKETDQIIKSL